MGWKEFISNVVGSLAWPAAIGLTVYLLRRRIGSFWGSPQAHRRVRGAKAELEFERVVEKAGATRKHGRPIGNAEERSLFGQLGTNSGESGSSWGGTYGGSSGDWGSSKSLVHYSPRAAVIEAWLRLERQHWGPPSLGTYDLT